MKAKIIISIIAIINYGIIINCNEQNIILWAMLKDRAEYYQKYCTYLTEELNKLQMNPEALNSIQREKLQQEFYTKCSKP